MQGIVFDIQRFALHDGPGIRTSVFLKGCALRCDWCCNPESQQHQAQLAFDTEKCTNCLDCINSCRYEALQSMDQKLVVNFEKSIACGECIDDCVPGALKIFGYETSASEVISEVLKDKSYFDSSNGGMTLSGGDPVFQPDFSYELLKLAKENKIHTCIETAGHCSTKVLLSLAEVTDLFLFDFKQTDPKLHKKQTGVSNELILKNLDALCNNGQAVVLRCPIIPGVNDNEDHFKVITELSERYKSILSVEVMAFHDWGFHKYESIGKNKPQMNKDSSSKLAKENWLDELWKMGCTKLKR